LWPAVCITKDFRRRNFFYANTKNSAGVSVRIGTSLQVGRPRNRRSIPDRRKKLFSLSRVPDLLSSPSSLLFRYLLDVIFLAVKQLGLEAHH